MASNSLYGTGLKFLTWKFLFAISHRIAVCTLPTGNTTEFPILTNLEKFIPISQSVLCLAYPCLQGRHNLTVV